MNSELVKLKRTHNCGELRSSDEGKKVILMGWVNRRRDLGGLIFIDLRDRYGITQIVFDPKKDSAVFKQAEGVRNEYVIAVYGEVKIRPEGTHNAALSTGEIDINVFELKIINQCNTLPFNMTDAQNPDEMLRLKYRYLDLRRPGMMQRIIERHRTAKAVRDFFDRENFLEVETPVLVNSTPEGARDYLVPSRVNQGRFYALPQSPQLFKQLLMISGADRYFQLAKCFRDEDLRADRQPEFTQIDLEMSFVQQEDILRLIENMLAFVFEKVMSIKLEIPFPRLTYDDAINRYGTDKPDLRFAMEIADISELVSGVDFEVFKKTLACGGKIKAMLLSGKAGMSRKETDELIATGKDAGLKGLLTVAFQKEGVKSHLAKFAEPSVISEIQNKMNALEGDMVLIAADEGKLLSECLGKLRLQLADKYKLIPASDFKFLWVLDFPLFKYNKEEQRIEAEHHPFTSPHPDDIHLMDNEPLKVRANAYDIVLNGIELGSGSIRIHERVTQEKIFKTIGLSDREAASKFGYLLTAFEYGAPPHGGIALGFDRMVAIMNGMESIREVIVFPKNQSAACPLTGAPVEVTDQQLDLLKIKVIV